MKTFNLEKPNRKQQNIPRVILTKLKYLSMICQANQPFRCQWPINRLWFQVLLLEPMAATFYNLKIKIIII